MASEMEDEDIVEVNLKEAIPSRSYKLRPTGKSGENSSVETTVPRKVIEREAKKRGLSLDDFIKEYRAVWYANQFDGLHLTFKKKEEV